MTNLAVIDQSWADSAGIDPKVSAFEQLANRYARDLHRYACWLCGDSHTAEDLVQDTMFRAWRSFDKLQSPRAIKSWLFTILRRENARRFERSEPLRSDVPLEDLMAVGSHYDTSTEAFVLRRALRGLPERYSLPLRLQIFEGYSQQQIAARLGISSGGVGTRLFRAKQKLRQALEE